MIPKSVADRIKNGQDPLKTCHTFDEVTVIFAEIEENTPGEVGAIQTAMNTVNTLNAAFTAFDEVFKICEILFFISTLKTFL